MLMKFRYIQATQTDFILKLRELWKLYSPESTAANAVANCATSWPVQGQVNAWGSRLAQIEEPRWGDTHTNDNR